MIMKKTLLILAAGLALAGCGKVGVVDDSNLAGKESPISFSISKKNMVKADAELQSTGHYNFGVFAYKSEDAVNNIMDNYLVGYHDGTNKKGYEMTEANQTTLGTSKWAYEKLGSSEYSYSGTDGYYTAAQTKYMSNVANQYLRYWDYASASTAFYAYAPYLNGTTASFDNSTKTLSLPNTAIVAGYDDESLYEYMYASTVVPKASYGQPVALAFKRLNAKVNIKFYEVIEGYTVKILDLNGTTHTGVQAAAAKLSGTTYSAGSYYLESGANIVFGTTATVNAVAGQTATNTTPLVFAAPTAAAIGEDAASASASATTYYAIPKPATTGGFTFHISYELTSTTGEKIVVKNATVFVPEANCEWEANKAYTYIFKITKGTNGSTDPDTFTSIDPTDVNVPDTDSLFPIIFDGCTVEDWVAATATEHTL